jgi:GGDEF domain-containing protein
VGDQRFPIGFSAGLAIYPEDGRDADSLVRVADGAMYREKSGRTSARGIYQLKVI